MREAITLNWRLLKFAVSTIRLIAYGYDSLSKIYQKGSLVIRGGGGSFSVRTPY